MNALLLSLATIGQAPIQCPTCPPPVMPQSANPFVQGAPQQFHLQAGPGLRLDYGGGYAPQSYGVPQSYSTPYGAFSGVPAYSVAAPSGGCTGGQALAFSYGGPQSYGALQGAAFPAQGSYAPLTYAQPPPAVYSYEPRSLFATIPYGAVCPTSPPPGRVRYVYRGRY
jgi:hypothetical protein